MLNLITAVSMNNVIGINNEIPWKCRIDLKHFKNLTMDNIVVMGRKTYESLFSYLKNDTDEPLPGRIKYVLTSNSENIKIKNNVFTKIVNKDNIFDFIHFVEMKHQHKNIFVIGGSQIYSLFNGYYNDLYITRINKDIDITPDNAIHYLPLTNSILKSDYELIFSNKIEYDEDVGCSIQFEQWRICNFSLGYLN